MEKLSSNYPNDWLAKLEIYEIIHKEDFLYAKELQKSILSNLNVDSDLLKAIKKSFQLIEQ